MWLVDANAILTKDNLSRKNWQGDKRCFFCNIFESIEHLFFDCHMSRYIWSLVAHIVGAVCRPSSFDQFWVWADKYIHNYKKIHILVSQRFAGLSGNLEMQFILKKSNQISY
jgi:hypothetical protein